MCVGNDTLAWDRGKTLSAKLFPWPGWLLWKLAFPTFSSEVTAQVLLLHPSENEAQRTTASKSSIESRRHICEKKGEKKEKLLNEAAMHTRLLQSMAHVPRKRRIWCVVPRDSSAKCFLNFRMLPTSLHINQANKKINSRMGGEDIWKTGESELTDNNGKDSKWLKRSSSLYIPFLQSLFFFYLKGGFSFRCLSK